jgi:type IV pilus assembly protein PilA
MYVRSNKSQAGFSLVELMVVVAIIGILASLAIPSVGKYMAKARQSEAKTQLASLYTAEKAFFAEYTVYDSRFGAKTE